jgi:predicted NBD/HSP70 family sugar kinase
VLNLTGQIEAAAALPAAGLDGVASLDAVYRLVETILPQTNAPLLGIGLATPGLVDPHNGIILRSVNLDWVNLPLRDLLEERFGHPVHIANDSHMAALAEYTYGDEPDSDNLIVLRVGRGIGAGIILGGRLFYGDGFGAGEIGHVVVDPAGQVCSCGNRGCLETTSSVRAMLSQARLSDKSQSLLAKTDVTWRGFSEAVALHDPVAVDIAVAAGCHLGTAAANLVGALNINAIVLAGRLADLDGLLLDAITAEMHQRVLPAMAQMTKVRFSSLGPERAPYIVSLGCAALLLHQELGIV